MASFTLFPTLPAEIRLKIWEQVLFSTPPQLLDIYTTAFPNPNEEDDYLGIDANGQIILDSCFAWLHQFLPSRRPPQILHINSEARSFFLPYFQLGFAYHRLNDSPPFLPKTCDHLKAVKSAKRNFYWNPNRDIIHYHHFPDALIPSRTYPGDYDYLCTLANTAAMWYSEAHALHSPRFLSVSFSMLLDWFGPHSRKPDLRNTEVLGVIVEKDPRHSDYQDLAWRDHQIRIADTDTWEESERYLEWKILEVVGSGIWKKGFEPKEKGMMVKVLRRVEDFVVFVDGLGVRKKVDVLSVDGTGPGEEGEGKECVVQ